MKDLKIDFAVYKTLPKTQPLTRFNDLGEAKVECLKSKCQTIVTEVCEINGDGTLSIINERIVMAPFGFWHEHPKYIPEYSGIYACYVETTELCGSITKNLKTIYYDYGKFQIPENEKVTHFTLLSDPSKTNG